MASAAFAFRKARCNSSTSLGSSSTWRRMFCVMERFLSICGRKFDPKGAAIAGRRFDADRAIHALGGFLHQRQADAGAGVGFDAMEPFENPKNSLLMFAWNADAIVAHPNAHRFATLLAIHGDFWRAFVRHEFHGVVQQIDQHQLEYGTIDENHSPARNDLDIRAALANLWLQLHARIFDHL